MDAAQYFQQALSLFSALPAYHTDQLLLAGRTVHLHTPSPALQKTLLFSLAHLLVPATDTAAALTIWYAEEKDLPAKLKAPPWTFNNQGYTTAIDQEDYQIFFLPWQKQLFLYSRELKTGIYWTSSAENLPWWEATFSFRTLFHLWTRDLPAQLVHAGAIAKDEHTAVLITGPSGSGKSTSCLNLVRAGYKYLGDDYVWVELEPKPVVHALYQTAKVEADNLLARFSDWKSAIHNPEDYKSQKAIFNMRALAPASWLNKAALKAILLPRVAQQENSVFQPASPAASLMGMAPTTLHHLPHHRQIAFQKFSRLSHALPAYQWQLGTATQQFYTSFQQFTDELS